MMEEHARVVDVQDGFVWVETERKSTCDGVRYFTRRISNDPRYQPVILRRAGGAADRTLVATAPVFLR